MDGIRIRPQFVNGKTLVMFTMAQTATAAVAPTSFLKPDTSCKLYMGVNFPRNSTSSSFPTFKCNISFSVNDLLPLSHNKVLIAAGVSAAIGQLSKPFTGMLFYGTPFDIKAFIQAGGFPSTHSSAVVATATCLALERGFSDSIFGMAAVYAALIMYDAQGVRREVGIHAKTLNKLIEYQTEFMKDEGSDTINSVSERSPSTNSGCPAALEDPSTFRNEQSTSTQLLESKIWKIRNEKDVTSLGDMAKESGRSPQFPLLKESIGHTEVEVIAGALLGFLVSLTVNAIM